MKSFMRDQKIFGSMPYSALRKDIDMDIPESVKSIRDSLVEMCSQMTYSFSDPSGDQIARFHQEVEATLKNYFGPQMQLTPEQMELFREAALNQVPSDEDHNRPGVMRMRIEMDETGKLSIMVPESQSFDILKSNTKD